MTKNQLFWKISRTLGTGCFKGQTIIRKAEYYKISTFNLPRKVLPQEIITNSVYFCG